MSNTNTVFLTGNLTRDPNVKVLPSGVSCAELSVAVNTSFTTKSGELRKEVDYIDCVAFDSAAEYIGQNFSKGDGIFIQGRFKQDRWETTEGVNRSRIVVRINTFNQLKRNGGGGGGGGGNGGYSNGNSNGYSNDNGKPAVDKSTTTTKSTKSNKSNKSTISEVSTETTNDIPIEDMKEIPF